MAPTPRRCEFILTNPAGEKSAVLFMLEAGCTDVQVAAVTGRTREMIEH